MNPRHLPEPSTWPTFLRRWRAADLDPAIVVVVLKGGAA